MKKYVVSGLTALAAVAIMYRVEPLRKLVVGA